MIDHTMQNTDLPILLQPKVVYFVFALAHDRFFNFTSKAKQLCNNYRS